MHKNTAVEDNTEWPRHSQQAAVLSVCCGVELERLEAQAASWSLPLNAENSKYPPGTVAPLCLGSLSDKEPRTL